MSKLQTLRKQAGLTQQELSNRSGVSLRTLQKYEIEDLDIDKATVVVVYRLALVLGCSVEDLISDDAAAGVVLPDLTVK